MVDDERPVLRSDNGWKAVLIKHGAPGAARESLPLGALILYLEIPNTALCWGELVDSSADQRVVFDSNKLCIFSGLPPPRCTPRLRAGWGRAGGTRRLLLGGYDRIGELIDGLQYFIRSLVKHMKPGGTWILWLFLSASNLNVVNLLLIDISHSFINCARS